MNQDERIDSFLTGIRKLSKLIFKAKSQIVKDFSLKSIHTIILFYLVKKGPLTNASLVRLTLEDKAAVSKALSSLKKSGLVEFSKGYNSQVNLTQNGLEVASIIYDEALDFEKEARKGISEEDANVFLDVLDKYIDNIQGAIKEGQ